MKIVREEWDLILKHFSGFWMRLLTVSMNSSTETARGKL